MGRLPADVVDLPESEGDLNDLRDEILEVIESARQRDHQAWIAAIRYKARVVAKLDRVLKAAAGTIADLPEHELHNRLRVYFSAMPDRHLRLAVEAYCERLGFRIVPVDE